MKRINGFSVIWIVVIVLLTLAIIGGGIYWWKNKKTSDKSSPEKSTTSQPTYQTEKWIKGSAPIMDGTTSTCTLALENNTFRMYFMQNGKVVYSDSTDGKTFLNPVLTGIDEDSGKMLSNPAVLKINSNNWIMIYEQQPTQTPGSQKNIPGPSNERDLYLATSTDGKTFSKVGIAIDSSKEDNYFASVPDLVMLPSGKIIMYYVSGGNAIGSSISIDNGHTWTRESGYRLENNAVDPDILYNTVNGKTSWVMYYSDLTGGGNALYKSVSSDGLTWQKGEKIIDASSKSVTIIDPDVVKISDNQYRMFFAEMSEDSSSTNPPKTYLYYADNSGNIFL